MNSRIASMVDVLALTGEMLPLSVALARRARPAASVWARPGMSVTFRAELMPGRASSDRTFRVSRVLPSGRVLIDGIAGEHAAAEFETDK